MGERAGGERLLVEVGWKVVGRVWSMKRVASERRAVRKVGRRGREAGFCESVGRDGWKGSSVRERGCRRMRLPRGGGGVEGGAMVGVVALC